MAYPSAYTEETLAEYMHSLITQDDKVNELTSTLRWSVANGSYDEAISEALGAVGASTITAVSGVAGIRKLRAASRVELWKLVMQRTAPAHQASDGQTTISRNQIWEHARDMYQMFLAEAIDIYGLTSYSVSVRAVQGGDVPLKVSMV